MGCVGAEAISPAMDLVAPDLDVVAPLRDPVAHDVPRQESRDPRRRVPSELHFLIEMVLPGQTGQVNTPLLRCLGGMLPWEGGCERG